MADPGPDDPMLDTEGEAFAHVARRFCAAVESSWDTEPRPFVAALLSSLAALYAAGLTLPDDVAVDPDWPDAPGLAAGLLEDVERAVARRLPLDLYPEVAELDLAATLENAATAVGVGSLVDDIGSTYAAVWSGLRTFEQLSAAAALFEWQLSFAMDWGRHAVDALRVLHHLHVDGPTGEPT